MAGAMAGARPDPHTYALRRAPSRILPTTILDVPACVLRDVLMPYVATPLFLPGHRSVKLECFADVVDSLRAASLTCKTLLAAVTTHLWEFAWLKNKVRVQASWNLQLHDYNYIKRCNANVIAARKTNIVLSQSRTLSKYQVVVPWAAPYHKVCSAQKQEEHGRVHGTGSYELEPSHPSALN